MEGLKAPSDSIKMPYWKDRRQMAKKLQTPLEYQSNRTPELVPLLDIHVFGTKCCPLILDSH